MFEDVFVNYPWESVKEKIYNSTIEDVKKAINKDIRHPEDFYPFFSPAADSFLEELAGLSRNITRKRFGNVIQLYAPLYISNECDNSCVYCGFNIKNDIRRLTLSPDLVEKESEILYQMGFRHILLVTGESRKAVPPEALYEIARRIHNKFASVSIEIYPMQTSEYNLMESFGVDGLTLYQETYHKDAYLSAHPAGQKKNFLWRLYGPERGGNAGFRRIGIGALLGLSDWRLDGFFCSLHAQYLMKKYWTSQIQVSFPRLKEASGNYIPPHPASDRDLTHLICVLRILLPDVGLLLSTRESSFLRDNIMPLGVTMMSAGSKTEPGGYSSPEAAGKQFKIDDDRSPEAVANMIRKKGFDPVWKDWDKEFLSSHS